MATSLQPIKTKQSENKTEKRPVLETILKNQDGSERSFGGITITNWGIILACLSCLYLFLGLYYAALINLAIEIRQEEWLKTADDYFGPFERANRVLYDAVSSEPVYALPTPEDLTLDTAEPIYWKFNRPDGCELTTFGTDPNTVEVLVCDLDGEKADNRWRVNPWIIDLATSSRMTEQHGCSFTNQNATILEQSGLYTGDNTCINGIILSNIDFS